MTAKPFLKWVGGKSRSAAAIADRVGPTEDVYAEPFLGSAAVFFELSNRGWLAGNVLLSDSSIELVTTFKTVRDYVDELIERLKSYRRMHERRPDWYGVVRDMDPGELSDVELAARMIYLNRTCFNGLYRLNRRGRFNVPKGNYANPRILDEDNLRACSKALQGAHVVCADFESMMREVSGRSVVYADPPYLPTGGSPNSFTGYSRHGFGLEDHQRLAARASALRDDGARVVVSSSDTPEAKKSYAGWSCEPIAVRRSVGRDVGSRVKIDELLFF